jgi:hypothetical protein
VTSLGELVSRWQTLAESTWLLGANRIGEAVARRFVEMGSQFSGMLRDYQLVDVDIAALYSQQHREIEEAIDALYVDAVSSHFEYFSPAEWSPADRTDNEPAQLGEAVDRWFDRLRDLETHSAEFAGNLNDPGSVWQGPAAHAALTPLWQWTGTGVFRRRLECLRNARRVVDHSGDFGRFRRPGRTGRAAGTPSHGTSA